MRISYYVQNSANQGLTIEYARVGLFLLILVISMTSSIAQGNFVNWAVLAPFYTTLALAFGLHCLWISTWQKLVQRPGLLFIGFILDSLAISTLIYYFGVNQSLFLFLHLVNILLAGIIFRGVGALILALLTSIFFTTAVLFSVDFKALNFFFLLVLNNIAFFSIAGLAGYLSEQLQSVGKELKQTGMNLRSVQELNQVLIENIPSGVVTFTEKGELVQANISAEEILEENNLRGKNWLELFPEIKMDQERYFRQDVRYRSHPDQDYRILGMTISKIYSPELEAYLCIALFDDLTKIRQLEFSARQNEKLAAVGGLAAGIAHEIRNPLAGISGSIELLSQTTHNEDDRKLMKIVLREIDRLNNLITEFLEYSRPETPPVDLVDLGSLLVEVLDAIKTDAKLRMDIQQHRELQSELVILGKRDKLKQVFLNIILNAYQAMSDSSKTSGSDLFIKGYTEDGCVQIRIKDNGCGMSEMNKKKMFEPFHTTKPKGTGLGLAVTHKILEGHGAQVYVESEEGVGTEFILTFPRAH